MKNLPLLLLILINSNLFAQATDSSVYFFNEGIKEKEGRRFLVASKHFEKAISLNPGFTNAFIENGLVSLEMKKTNPAIQNFSKAHELDPKNQTAIRQLASLFYNYRQYDKAIKFAELCKGCEGADKIIGMSLYYQENYPEAEKKLLAVSKSGGNDPEVLYTLGRNYLDMEEYNKAIPYYEKAVIIDPTKAVWIYELGLIYFNQYQYSNAMVSFEKAGAAGYNQTNDFKENLGYAAMYAGNFERGEALLQEVLAKKPGNKDIMRDLAEIFYQKKQYDKSLEYCQKLMEKDPKDGKALYQAGLNFQKKGQKDRGQQMCDKAIEMDPSLASLRQKKEMPGM